MDGHRRHNWMYALLGIAMVVTIMGGVAFCGVALYWVFTWLIGGR